MLNPLIWVCVSIARMSILLRNLIHSLFQYREETVTLKAAIKGCPTKLYDTLSSFSNQDDGGIIIFGIDESDNYSIKGVYDAQDLQKKVTER